jgi:hypothetical protein
MYSSATSQRIQHNSSDYFDHKILVQCSHSVAGRFLKYRRTFRQSGAAQARALPPWLIYLYSLSSYALRGASPDLGRLPTSHWPGVACVPTCFPPGSLSPGHDPESRQFTGSFPAQLSQIIAANGPELYLDVHSLL